MKHKPSLPVIRAVEARLGAEQLLKPLEAALMLGVCTGTLDHWRSRAHCGPDFIRVGGKQGHIRYSLKALREYMNMRTERPSRSR